ncbi:MAG: hypothetical protein GY864_11975 [Desulfobacterales bacterium]|nr:hypothetical protein [Desulfobacterales bacterium]
MRTIQELLPALPTKILTRLLYLGIIFYAILIVIVIITGGFKIDVMSVSIKATRLDTPIKIIFALILLRVFISIEIKNFILMMTSLLLCLAAMEISIRVWNPNIAQRGMKQIHKASKFLGWDLIPGASGTGNLGEFYQINASGFRGPEFKMEKKPGIQRIMVIGDSFTFGMGVNWEDAYPTRLERILNEKKRPCEVINCGVIAHHMWQHDEMLRGKVLSYKPDLIILGLYQDDISASVPPFIMSADYQGVNIFKNNKDQGFMTRFFLWNVLENTHSLIEYKYRYQRGYTYLKRIKERKKKIGPSNPTNSYYRTMAGKIEKHKYSEFAGALKRFVKTANDAGTEVLVAMIPDSVQLNDSHMQEVNRIVERTCGKVQVPFVDTTPFLEAGGDPFSLYLFPFNAHNNPKGLQIIAAAIAEQIVKLELLEYRDQVLE